MDKKKPNGFFSNMSNDELISYVEKNHKGKTPTQLRNSEGTIYNFVLNRNLSRVLIESGVLRRKNSKKSVYEEMTNEQLVDYLRRRCFGKSLGEVGEGIGKGRDRLAYKVACERGLKDYLIEQGVLLCKSRRNFFKDMPDSKLIEYIEQRYSGRIISKMKSEAVYEIALRRGLINVLVRRGILIRETRHKFFSNMNDKKFIEYVKKHHVGKTIDQMRKEETGCYDNCRKRELFSILIDKEILLRARVEDGAWKDLEFTLKKAEEFMREEDLDYVPSGTIMRKSGYSGLAQSISLYHGGFPAFREKLKEYMGQSSGKSELESLVLVYIEGGKDEQ